MQPPDDLLRAQLIQLAARLPRYQAQPNQQSQQATVLEPTLQTATASTRYRSRSPLRSPLERDPDFRTPNTAQLLAISASLGLGPVPEGGLIDWIAPAPHFLRRTILLNDRYGPGAKDDLLHCLTPLGAGMRLIDLGDGVIIPPGAGRLPAAAPASVLDRGITAIGIEETLSTGPYADALGLLSHDPVAPLGADKHALGSSIRPGGLRLKV